jgi:glucose-1-phosphate thymidylyltransferase
VGGEPLITRCLETLRELGIDEAVVVVGYKRDRITGRYGESFRGLDLSYARQPDRDGLAHAVLAARTHVESGFVVLNRDNIYAGNLGAAVDRHRRTDADSTIPVEAVPPETATRGAVCELDGSGNLTGVVEKPEEPPSTRVRVAFYVLPPEILPACRIVRPSSRGEYELPDAIDLLIGAGYGVETVPFEGWKLHVNTKRDIERAERKLSQADGTTGC